MIPARHSPCIGLCKIDEETQLCLGCTRSAKEIAAWPSLDAAGRDAIWARLPARLPLLSVPFRILPWTTPEIADFVLATLRGSRPGTWTVGTPGAGADFPCAEERKIETWRDVDAVIGRASDACFRLRLHDRLRAFQFSNSGAIVLGLPKTRFTLPTTSAVTALGPDANSIDPAFKGLELFDLGLGRRWSRFCLRTEAEPAARLQASRGRAWHAVLAELGSELSPASTHRVVESELTRVEVFARNPAAHAKAPAGALAHFHPKLLLSSAESPEAHRLPDYAAAVASFRPEA